MDDSIVGVSVVVVVADRNLYRYPFMFVALPLILALLGGRSLGVYIDGDAGVLYYPARFMSIYCRRICWVLAFTTPRPIKLQ